METNLEFYISDGCIRKIDVTSGNIISIHKPIGTSIAQFLMLAENLIIREDYYAFPVGESNVYCLNKNFEVLWFAELPSKKDVYANHLIVKNGFLYCASWDGMSCTIDLNGGAIVESFFTK